MTQERMTDMPVSLFDKAIEALQDIQQLEPEVMKGLFWSSKPNLQSVHKMEKPVCAQRERIQAALTASLKPVSQYITTYQEYRPVLKLDPHAFMKEFEAADHSLDAVREKLTEYLRDRAKMEKRVPLNVHIGMYTLNCEPIRNALAAKYLDLGNLVLELMAKKTRAICEEIQKQYDMMVGTIKKAAQTVEDVSQTREYIVKNCSGTSDLMLEMDAKISSMLMNSDILEEYKYNFNKDDIHRRWHVFSLPKRMTEEIEKQKQRLEQVCSDPSAHRGSSPFAGVQRRLASTHTAQLRPQDRTSFLAVMVRAALHRTRRSSKGTCSRSRRSSTRKCASSTSRSEYSRVPRTTPTPSTPPGRPAGLFRSTRPSSAHSLQGTARTTMLRQVNSFFKNQDIGKVDEVAAEVKKIQKRLKEIDKKAKQFNQREALFNRQMTDYSDVNRVIKNFEPYGNLWSTSFDWVRSQKVRSALLGYSAVLNRRSTRTQTHWPAAEPYCSHCSIRGEARPCRAEMRAGAAGSLGRRSCAVFGR
jgi:hypothetical protein